jgi:hypothetical protein
MTYHDYLDMCGTVLDAVGTACDAVNAGAFVYEENYPDAAVAAVGLVPGASVLCKVGKWCKRVADAIANAVRRAADVAKAVADGIRAAAQAAQQVVDEAMDLTRRTRNTPPTPPTRTPTKPPTNPDPKPDRPGGKPSCQANSFIPGTLVLLADGTTETIEDIRVGDIVLVTGPNTGRTEARPVTATIIGDGDKHLVVITIDTDGDKGDQVAVVTATDGHPFWLPEESQWMDARNLQPGQWLQTSAGTWIQITAIRHQTRKSIVYNLTVADIHTYYVVAGDTPILVHNDNGPRLPNLDRTWENYDTYLQDVAKYYGINLRGVTPVWDSSLRMSQAGLTKPEDGGWVIRINPAMFDGDSASLANTLAHELHHARDFQKGNFNSPEPPAYAAGNAMEAHIRGC